MNSGFTLLELVIVVAIIGIISAIGLPQYVGYTESTNDKVIENNLRSIFLKQQEYYRENNNYYSTGETCTNAAADINNNLFSGQNVITTPDYNFCILSNTDDDFEARAEEVEGDKIFTIDENNDLQEL